MLIWPFMQGQLYVGAAGPDLAGGRPGAQPNYGSISVTTVFT